MSIKLKACCFIKVVSMNNRIIDVVQHFNYLGIMLDADMSLEGGGGAKGP